MKKETEQWFYETYPQLFREHSLPATQTCMCWGLDVGDGWTDILKEMCESIQNHIKETGNFEVAFTQVKEKFGSLRVYVNGGDDKIYDFINEAERKSEITCEQTGKPAKIQNVDGWYKTVAIEE